MKAVFGDAPLASKRLIVIDRFYTSVALAIQLLMMGFYSVGTIQTNHLGYCKEIICKKKTRPKDKDRGSCKISESTHVPGLRAICWMDTKPVHFLTCGGSVELDRVVRKDKTCEQQEVVAPRVIKDYHKFMGGVDVHDQLRLQRYSIQRAVTFRKYYKSLFLGLIDMAIVNSYIVHKAYHETKATRPLKHVKFMKKLHLQLTQLQESDMYEGNTFGDAEAIPTSGTLSCQGTTHVAELVDEWRNQNTPPKRRQRACKVCGIMKDAKPRTTAYHCGSCDKTPVYLWMRPWHTIRGKVMTCFDAWHQEWREGKLRPSIEDRRIRMRPTTVAEGSRKRQRTETE